MARPSFVHRALARFYGLQAAALCAIGIGVWAFAFLVGAPELERTGVKILLLGGLGFFASSSLEEGGAAWPLLVGANGVLIAFGAFTVSLPLGFTFRLLVVLSNGVALGLAVAGRSSSSASSKPDDDEPPPSVL